MVDRLICRLKAPNQSGNGRDIFERGNCSNELTIGHAEIARSTFHFFLQVRMAS
jgi:hypothetical protein